MKTLTRISRNFCFGYHDISLPVGAKILALHSDPVSGMMTLYYEYDLNYVMFENKKFFVASASCYMCFEGIHNFIGAFPDGNDMIFLYEKIESPVVDGATS
jgi:hypothetical protein